MLACLPLLAVAPARSHGIAWRLLALLIPLVRALARRAFNSRRWSSKPGNVPMNW